MQKLIKIRAAIADANQAMPKTKGAWFKNIFSQIHFVVAGGLHTSWEEAIYLIKNIDIKLIFVGYTYNTNEILPYLKKQNIKPVI